MKSFTFTMVPHNDSAPQRVTVHTVFSIDKALRRLLSLYSCMAHFSVAGTDGSGNVYIADLVGGSENGFPWDSRRRSAPRAPTRLTGSDFLVRCHRQPVEWRN
jgi:hypothetical protein